MREGILAANSGHGHYPLANRDFTYYRGGGTRRDISVEVFQCDICMNIQFFGLGQPYKGLYAINGKSRVNPEPSKGSSLRW
jgi:hypothetical protein